MGRFGKFECDFIVRGTDMQHAYVQVAYTIALSKETEDREYRPLESIKDNIHVTSLRQITFCNIVAESET